MVRRRRREDDVDVEQVVDADLLGLGDQHGRDAGGLALVLQEVLLEVAGMVVVAGKKSRCQFIRSKINKLLQNRKDAIDGAARSNAKRLETPNQSKVWPEQALAKTWVKREQLRLEMLG